MRSTVLALLALAVAASRAPAQSLTSGSLSGSVRDEAGLPVLEATVQLIDDVTGIRLVRTTPRNGTFNFPLLQPADYRLLVERFGYRPMLVYGLPVQSGAELRADVALTRSGADAVVDSVPFAGVPARGAMLSLEHGATRDFAALADPLGLLIGVEALLPAADGRGGAAGLPGSLAAIGMDGIPHLPPRHARLPSHPFDALSFPAPAVRSVELLSRALDAEWTGAGGGFLAGTTRPGTRVFSATLQLAGGPGLQNGSLIVAGPVMRDTAHFALGVNFARARPTLPAPWTDSLGTKLASIAQDSFNTPLSSQLAEVAASIDVLSGFARFDWAVSPRHRLGLRASAGSATAGSTLLGGEHPLVPGNEVTARQLSFAATLSSVLSGRAGNEIRVSVDAGSREYLGLTLPRTVFAEAGLGAGTTDLAPGTFKRTSLRLAETLHYRIGAGLLKAGLDFVTTSHVQTFGEDRSGTFYFGDTTGFATGNGVFTQTVGPLPIADFRTTGLGLFAQALLRVTPALELRAGLRYDGRGYPSGSIPRSTEWQNLTGLDNSAAPADHGVIAPRFGFSWNPGSNRGWSVDGEAAVVAEALDPAVWAEAVTRSGNVNMRRAVGAVGAWPATPDSVLAPVRGRVLTLLGPEFEAPRSSRMGLGITGSLGGTLVMVQGLYRHTDFLPVRRDLNLPSSPNARDQYGRPLYGTLVRAGTLLAAQPGSNRRFSGFDQVASLDPAGASDFWGLTIEVRRNLGRSLDLLASYTVSRTTDNWFGARAGTTDATLLPFPDSVGESSWVQGTSDFDLPHRATLGAQVRFGGRVAPRIGVLYRFRSGYPFTPGFRDGVDANADGSARNDPAFVTDTVAGAASLVAASACLRGQVGSFARRNSCREPSVSSLDLTMALTLWRRGGRTAELVADVIGVVRSGLDQTDRALYLVDPAAAMPTSAAGVTAVPLTANPNFGAALSSRDPGALWRVGVRMAL